MKTIRYGACAGCDDHECLSAELAEMRRKLDASQIEVRRLRVKISEILAFINLGKDGDL